MVNKNASRPQRPISPFMLGSAYRPQLTSMLSITHRITGVFLTLGALLFISIIYAISNGPDAYRHLYGMLSNPFGILMGYGFIFSLLFHLLNGIRHLLWDIGWGLDLSRSYQTGWAVVILSIVLTVVMGIQLLG